MTWFGNPLPENAATETTTVEIGILANENSSDIAGTLGKILKELKLINLHLASMTDEQLTKEDIGE